MSQEQSINTSGLSLKSTNDLSAAQYTTIIADTSNAHQCVQGGANGLILGILQNKPKAGEIAEIRTARGSSSKAIASGAIAKGVQVMGDSSGKIKTAATPACNVIGISLEAAAANGDVIEIMLVDGYIA